MTDTPDTAIPAATRRKAVFAAALGNFIEWFEFTVYGFFAAAIAANFFPAGSGGSSLIATFAVFGVAFVLRPLGAFVFGHYGDRFGRRATLSAAILGMSLSTFAIGILPSYASAGTLAPVLLLLARIVQGFCAGGEFGGATAFMIEYAPPHRRALYGSWQFFTQFFAGFVAALVGAVLSTVLPAAALDSWGWRLPFLLALPLGLVGLYLRLRLDETPQFEQARSEKSVGSAPLLDILRTYWKSLLTIIGLIVMGTTATYMIQAFFPAFLVAEVGLSEAEMFTAVLVGVFTLMVLTPLWGLAADRVGRCKPFLIASPVGALVFIVPIHLLLLQGTFAATVAGYVALVVVMSPITGVLAIVMADAFPTQVRYSGLSIGYSAAVSVFGGFTPLILTSLVEGTGSALAPAFYLAGTAVVTLIAAFALRERGTRPVTRVVATADAPAHSRDLGNDLSSR